MKQMAHFLIIFWKEENVSAAVAHNEMYIVSEFLSSDLKPHFLVNFKWLSMSGSRREQVTYILKNAFKEN